MKIPRASVIIPSHNRCASLERVLEGLRRQTPGQEDFEVIVVLDGTTDSSQQMLARWRDEKRLLSLAWICQEQQGQATARNVGANKAQGEVLVFLDDDVVPSPGLLQAHLRWHQQQDSVAVLGNCPVVKTEQSTWYDLVIWMWWEDMYYARSQPGHIASYRDFCAGNISLRREDFRRVGGFDTEFRGYGGEDYDLGYRLLKQGVRFIVDQDAHAEHHHRGSARAFLNSMRSEGRNDVLLGLKHPELRAGLRFLRQKNEMRVVFFFPAFCYLGMLVVRGLLAFYERFNLRGSWRRLFGKLRHYAYWRGVQERLGTWSAFEKYRTAIPEYSWCKLDITDGLPEKLPAMGSNGPCELMITAAGRELGYFFIEEPLGGDVHALLADRISSFLKPQLWTYLSVKNIIPWEESATLIERNKEN